MNFHNDLQNKQKEIDLLNIKINLNIYENLNDTKGIFTEPIQKNDIIDFLYEASETKIKDKSKTNYFNFTQFEPKDGIKTIRGNDNVKYAGHIFLDFDDTSISPKDIGNIFPYSNLVMNTYSNNYNNYRYRLLIFINKSTNGYIYNGIAKNIYNEFKEYSLKNNLIDGIDKTKLNASNIFLLPCKAKIEKCSFFIDNSNLDELNVDKYILKIKEPEIYAPFPTKRLWNINQSKLDQYINVWRCCPKGQGHLEFFKLGMKVYGHTKDFNLTQNILEQEVEYANNPYERKNQIKSILDKILTYPN